MVGYAIVLDACIATLTLLSVFPGRATETLSQCRWKSIYDELALYDGCYSL
jgi:hypothetical protein